MLTTRFPASATPKNRGLSSDLSNLERLGAFFTSQLHDINNQIAVLSNAQLLLEISDLPVSKELGQYLDGLFSSINRLSATCNGLNTARKAFPIELKAVSLSSVVSQISGAASVCPGWTVKNEIQQHSQVFLKPDWVPTIVSQLIAHLPGEGGTLTLSTGELPLRHYRHSLRTPSGKNRDVALLVHLVGKPESELKEIEKYENPEFPIALELIRLMGAGLSLGLSNNERDFLLAFPMNPKSEIRRSFRIPRR